VDEQSGSEIVRSDQPLYDGARALLAAGEPPQTLLTMRHAGQSIDAWNPTAIGELAKWTVVERNRDGLARQRWKPHPKASPAPAVPSRIDVEAVGATRLAGKPQSAFWDSPHRGAMPGLGVDRLA
jgi:hypothetical protein